MAYDPIQEDCLRLILGSMQRDRIYPLENPQYIASCIDAFNIDPARLIATDRDRSFHLVTLATETIDYRLPFERDNEKADQLASKAESQLREACELDPTNWDAQRMLAALGAATNDAYVSYLLEHRSEVEAAYEKVAANTSDVYTREYAGSFGHRPLVRWLAALASRALVAGRYRLALDTAEDCLAFAPDDPVDMRLTAMLAMAKLEYTRDDLRAFKKKHAAAYRSPIPQRRRHHTSEKTQDAWELLAELAIAYHELDYAGATRTLRTLLQTCAHAAEVLFYQAEFPEGVFGRVHVEPGSEDELALAVSEATLLLQEGLGAPENASLAAWVASHELVQDALKRSELEHALHGGVPSGGVGGSRAAGSTGSGNDDAGPAAPGGFTAGGDN